MSEKRPKRDEVLRVRLAETQELMLATDAAIEDDADPSQSAVLHSAAERLRRHESALIEQINQDSP